MKLNLRCWRIPGIQGVVLKNENNPLVIVDENVGRFNGAYAGLDPNLFSNAVLLSAEEAEAIYKKASSWLAGYAAGENPSEMTIVNGCPEGMVQSAWLDGFTSGAKNRK